MHHTLVLSSLLRRLGGHFFLMLPLIGLAQTGTEIRQLALTHSGAYDFYTINGQPAGDSLYPYVSRMAQAGGHSYRLDGTFGPQFDPSNPTGAFVAEVQAATEDGFVSQWRVDSDTPLPISNVPGATLSAKAYNSFMFSPRNFVGFWFNEQTGEIALNDQGIPEGINPENDPAGFQALVDEYVASINLFLQRSPGTTIHIYEFLPPAFAFPYTEDATQDNTIAQVHIDNFVAHALGRHQGWLDALADGIRNHPQLASGAVIRTVPINRVVAELLRDHPGLLVGRDWFDFARDGAPHFGDANGSSDFFEAFLAPVLYGVLFEEAVPANFTLEGGNLFAADFPTIRSYVATALSSGGSGGSSGPGSFAWARWEDDSPDWTVANGTTFNPTIEGLPAPENTSVLSLYSSTSEATLDFQGSGIRVYGLVFPGAATAEIFLNDTLVASPVTSATTAAPGTLLWESGPLAADTPHRLRIRSTGDWVAVDYVEIFTDEPGSSGPGGGAPVDPGGPEPPDGPTPPPVIDRPDVSGAYEFTVATDGSGDTDSIRAAVNAARPGDTIRVLAGAYAESITIATANLSLIADGAVQITGGTGATNGIRVDADDVEIRGFTVSGIMGYNFPGDHSATGFVLNAARTRLIDCVSHSNGFKGFLVLPAARDVLMQGGSAYDNSAAGIGIAGGTGITIRDMRFYSTGPDGGDDGTFQPTAILSDNWGDYDGSPSNIIPLDGIQPITDLIIDNVTVYDHPDYGIRISAYNESLSSFPSGRIATTNLQLTNSHIYNNGSRLSDFVGGLYHLGGVLIQHVDGGLIAGNVMENNYFWGIDAYRCNQIIYRDNWFLNNNRGMTTPGVTFEPVNVEINGGLNNLFTNNLIYGGFSGLFVSWIPDSNDGPVFGPDSILIEHNIMAGHTEGGLSMVMNNEGLSTRTVRNNFIEQIPALQISYLREDHGLDLEAAESGNRIGTAPGFTDPGAGDFTPQPGSPLENTIWGPASLRPAGSDHLGSWLQVQLGAGATASELDPLGDPDGDALPNLLEYATGSHPGLPDFGSPIDLMPNTTATPGVRLILRADDPGLIHQLQHSWDLRTWRTCYLNFNGSAWRTSSPSITLQDAQDLGNGLWQLDLSLPAGRDSGFTRLSVGYLTSPL